MSLHDLPFKEYLQILQDNGKKDDAEEIEKLCHEIIAELGWTKEQLDETPHGNVLEILDTYLENLQTQMAIAQKIDTPSVPMSGMWLVGKDVPQEKANQVMRIMAQRMQEEKERLRWG